MTRSLTALLISSYFLGCAEGSLDGLEGDSALSGTVPDPDVIDAPAAPDDSFAIPAEDLPTAIDVVSPELDAGAPADVPPTAIDAASPELDAVTVTDVPSQDLASQDLVRTDSVVGDVGPSCAAPRVACSGSCVDLAGDAQNCGSCGAVCSGSTPACASGRCGAPGCGSGASDCDSNAANGCEVSHMSSALCGSAPDLGAWCGDASCGFLCPSNSSRVVSTRTGRAGAWFRGRTNECSNCPARLEVSFTLAVPPGVDYDLYVYSACGGAVLGRSLLLEGQTDRVSLSRSGDFGSDSFNWWVEVRYVRGGSCAPWTLTVQTRSNSGSSC